MSAASAVSAAGGSRRSWGWHRLDDDWAARVVAAAGVRPGELVLDIGAGTGALTGHLLATGARVVAVELNAGRVRVLRQRFPDATVVHVDAVRLPLPGRPFRVVANPPFALTAELLWMLLARDSRLTAADLILERAVVRKYVARGTAARRFSMTAGLALPRRAFQPRPRVDCSVLTVRRRSRP